MQFSAPGLLIGILVCQQLAVLPSLNWSWLLLPCVVLVLASRKSRPALMCVTGFLWASLVAHGMLASSLDPGFEGKDLQITGVIASLPRVEARRTRFEFVIDELLDDAKARYTPEQKRQFSDLKLLLSWYNNAPELRVGQRWRLKVRVKRPHGFMNPGGFDYEGWLFQKGIHATGSVRSTKNVAHNVNGNVVGNVQIETNGTDLWSGHLVDQQREALRDGIDRALPGNPFAGMIKALAIGDRDDISFGQWQGLTRTGTSHLLAISGLHIGLVAGLLFFAMRKLWSRSERAVLRVPAPVAAAIAAIAGAVIYAALAGFSIPTQRALIMVVMVMSAIILQRNIQPGHSLSFALIVVLLLDPLSVSEAGFWLSFGAVAIILYGMSGRVRAGYDSHKLTGAEQREQWFWQWGRVQWLVVLGLAPILLVYFQKLSLVAPLVNMIAVPWVSLVTVPLTLLGSLLLVVLPLVAQWLLQLAALSLEGLWFVIDGFAGLELAQWTGQTPPPWTVWTSLVGVVWLLAPRGFPARGVGILWLMPLVLLPQARLDEGQARFVLLDVGQGLAAVVQTRNHLLVYDTGPRYSDNFDTGRAVITPWLRYFGLDTIDLLVVSHGDNDHSGGAKSLTEEIDVRAIVTSTPEKIQWRSTQLCNRKTGWQWDGVRFQIIHPGSDPFQGDGNGNNRSCVLRVTNDHGSVLLSGDIEIAAERYLVTTYRDKPEQLQADVLVVPHHGSLTSSGEAFIDAVNPAYALLPIGYRNRYGFPKQAVVERYLQRNITLLDSAQHGAIRFDLDGQGIHLAETWRQAARRYWHADKHRMYSKQAITAD